MIYIILIVILIIILLVLGIHIVPQGQNYVVARLGKQYKSLEPGINFMVPFIDRIVEKISVKDQAIDIPTQDAITQENALIKINAIAYIRVIDPQKAVYSVEDHRFAVSNLIQTALRSVVAEMQLDDALSSRERIKNQVTQKVSNEVSDWGIRVRTVEIKDIKPSEYIQEAMEKKAAAERNREAYITEADGKKQAEILNAEARLESAKRDAEANRIMSEATSETIENLGKAIGNNKIPANFVLGDNYIAAMKSLAKSDNAKMVVLPPDILKAIDGLLARR